MLGLFIEAADIMDGLFWQQAYGERKALLDSLAGDRARRDVLPSSTTGRGTGSTATRRSWPVWGRSRRARRSIRAT